MSAVGHVHPSGAASQGNGWQAGAGQTPAHPAALACPAPTAAPLPPPRSLLPPAQSAAPAGAGGGGWGWEEGGLPGGQRFHAFGWQKQLLSRGNSRPGFQAPHRSGTEPHAWGATQAPCLVYTPSQQVLNGRWEPHARRPSGYTLPDAPGRTSLSTSGDGWLARLSCVERQPVKEGGFVAMPRETRTRVRVGWAEGTSAPPCAKPRRHAGAAP